MDNNRWWAGSIVTNLDTYKDMKEIKAKTEKVWVIAHNSDNVFHPIELEAGLTLSTGQPFLEEFETEEAMVARLTELTGDPAFWDKLKNDDSETDSEEI